MTQRQLVGRTVTVLGLVVLTWVAIALLREMTEILVLLLVSAVLAAGLSPIVAAVERWRIPGGLRFSRGVAIFVLYIGIFLAIAGLLSIIIVPVVNESGRFIQQLPQLVREVVRKLAELHNRFPWLPDLAISVDRLRALATQLTWLGPQAANVAFRLFGGVAAAITVLVFTFYMLLQGAQMKRGFVVLFPPQERAQVSLVLERIGAKFGGWLRAQLLLSLSVAVPVGIGLALLHIPYPFLLAIVAGLGELIPMVGPALGAAAAFLVALTQQTWQLIGVIVFYVIIMNVEPHILVPRIMSRVVGLSPILTLVALLTGIKLLGILGALLSVPVAAALQVIVAEVIREIRQEPMTPASTAAPSAAAPAEQHRQTPRESTPKS